MFAFLLLSLLAYPLLGFLVRPFTTFFHELGHAIPTLYYTRSQKTLVEIFVGSYGDEDDSFSIRLGRLKIWICWNPFPRRGYCRANIEFTIDQRIVQIICGPIASLIVSLFCTYFFVSSYSSFTSLLLGMFFISSFWDLLSNLGDEVKFELEDGTVLYSDGYLLKQYLALKDVQSDL